MFEALLAIGTIAAITLALCVLGNMLVNCRHWRTYQAVFEVLPLHRFARVGTQLQSELIGIDSKALVLLMLDNGNMKLNDEVWLFNEYPFLFDPYAAYWLRRYHRYFRNYYNQEPARSSFAVWRHKLAHRLRVNQSRLLVWDVAADSYVGGGTYVARVCTSCRRVDDMHLVPEPETSTTSQQVDEQ